MDKRRAIQIMTNAAKVYRDNLEDQKLMFFVWDSGRGETKGTD